MTRKVGWAPLPVHCAIDTTKIRLGRGTGKVPILQRSTLPSGNVVVGIRLDVCEFEAVLDNDDYDSRLVAARDDLSRHQSNITDRFDSTEGTVDARLQR